jgi:CubicO group peptidase (beta-lactamase class C family)
MIAKDTLNGVLAQVDELMVSTINEKTLAGMGVAIVRGGRVVYSRGMGMADAAAGRPITPETVYRIGSTSKTMTAIGLMRLWEQGAFKLDDPVCDYLKGCRIEHSDPDAQQVTFRHLLTHTSGLGELRGLSDLLLVRTVFGLGARLGEPVPPVPEMYGGRLVTELHPGVKWAYANHGFALLGQVVSDISGEPFPEYMIRNVFEPLGMRHTDYIRSERVRSRLAVGYQFARGRMKPVDDLEIAVSGAGSVFSSLEDMGRYVTALLNGGKNEHGSVLKPETLRMMVEPHHQIDPRLPAMGLSFMLGDFGGHLIAQHGGGWLGFVSAMYTAPDDGIGVLAYTNTSSLAPDPFAVELMHQLLGVLSPASRLPRPGVLETPHLWPELSGSYGPSPGLNTNLRVWMGFGGELEVGVKDGHLALRALLGPISKGIRLYPVDSADPLLFHAVLVDGAADTVLFGRGPGGEVDRLHMGFNTFYKRLRAQSLRFRLKAGLGVAAGLAGLGLLRRIRG